jgi:hypothetical protein
VQQAAAVTGADLNAMEERLLAQLAAMKPPTIRLIAMVGHVDTWIAVWVRAVAVTSRQPASWG